MCFDRMGVCDVHGLCDSIRRCLRTRAVERRLTEEENTKGGLATLVYVSFRSGPGHSSKVGLRLVLEGTAAMLTGVGAPLRGDVKPAAIAEADLGALRASLGMA